MKYFQLFTGGSRGIGRGITRSLAASGHDIIFTYNSNEEAAKENKQYLIDTFKIKCEYLQADFVSDNEKSVERCFAVVDQMSLAGFKGFVHNAGGYYHAFDKGPNLVDVQKYSSIYAHTFLMLMEKSKDYWKKSTITRKCSVGISSPGVNLSSAPFVSYIQPGVGKAGLEYLVRVYAKELRPDGITINSVSPGYTKTEAWNPVLAMDEVRLAVDEKIAEKTSGGWILPEEIGGVVNFLFSDASRSITGQFFDVDRGQHLQ